MFVRFDPCRDFEPLCQPFGRRGWGVVQPFVIPMDAYLEDKNVVVNFDLPGLRLDAIALTLETNLLTVRAERAWQFGDRNGVLVSERPHGSFSRRIFLGGVDAAGYRSHVLRWGPDSDHPGRRPNQTGALPGTRGLNGPPRNNDYRHPIFPPGGDARRLRRLPKAERPAARCTGPSGGA